MNDIKEILKELESQDFGWMTAKEFSDLIFSKLKDHFLIKKEVKVSDRGDGYTGRIDMVLFKGKESVGIELDRKTPRVKSIFKLRALKPTKAFVITRCPVILTQVPLEN